jgi:hypothetical protein
MSYTKLAKQFNFPDDFSPPTKMTHKDLEARPLTRQDLKDDLEAVNSSIDIIQKTRGGSWPQEQLTEDFDFLDLAWHEREFRDRTSLAYVVYSDKGHYIGCFYLYPIGIRTPLINETESYDVDVSWWVSNESYENGYYKKLYSALKSWMQEFPFKATYYSNKEIPK